ncbi:Ferrous iron transport protein B [Olavius algarvensis spirochete endosymbiont]|uniref:Fe(2+) transporter permease subunit FeoB n=1 Tax=Olavius algarvensis spirochete endosymbiont TaxID=260710 RepID=UPI00052C3F50|nr:Fe(2+) transporter permease subunit FeoB [Olavius algarvensis spirochete endosymbiont]KGM38603.1 hypothetical protein JY97_15260 [Alkalispirochaeta odontotermitis]VDB00045.1 Ferrous iron transport protein B [Olavius algarvensis spirochete endosymbiont]
MNRLSIALVGNPNSGKTTLFNDLTGSIQHVGNWPGLTVEKKSGLLLGNKTVEVIDLPGIYSLNTLSEDAVVARNFILSNESNFIINIVDSSNLERNLFLTLTLIEIGKPMLLVLNMIDIAIKHGFKIDVDGLSDELGIPVIVVNALRSTDTRDLRRAIKKCLSNPRISNSKPEYPRSIEEIIGEWSSKLGKNSRFDSIRLLEEDDETRQRVISKGCLSSAEIESAIRNIKKTCMDTPDTVITRSKHTQILKLIKARVKQNRSGKSVSMMIDKFVLNSWLGIPVFLAIIYLLFWVVIHVGGAFIDFFDIVFGAIFVDSSGLLLTRLGAPDWLKFILADGLGGGIQTVATFIPIIFSMFFMLSILEESGYMARASYVMDRFMRSIGLPGKSFVPMLVGFGCTVPAILATRTLENKKDRYLTVFMAPFMSCSARLPVYALFGIAFFGKQAGLMIVSIYLFGILLAVITGFMLKNTLFKEPAAPLAMILPPYHLPKIGTILHRTKIRLQVFILRAGKVITIAVLFLSSLNSMGTDGSFGNENSRTSVLSVIGRSITPVFAPMGLEQENWPATVGLFAGIFAKESIVGTINSLYEQTATGEEKSASLSNTREFLQTIGEAFRSIPKGLSIALGAFDNPLGTEILNESEEAVAEEIGSSTGTFLVLRRSFGNDWVRAYSYLLFVLIYFPCVATMGAAIKEIGIKFGVLSICYLTVLAWSVATLFFQIARGHSVPMIILALALVLIFVPVFNLVRDLHIPRRKGS